MAAHLGGMSQAQTNDSDGQYPDDSATLEEPGNNPRQPGSTPTSVIAGPNRAFGYARVSTGGQDAARQVTELREAGCDEVFTDTASGTRSAVDRPGLADLLSRLRKGDRLMVVELSRLGRRTKDVLALVEDLDAKGVGLVIQNLGVDTATPSGRMVLSVVAAIAQMEQEDLSRRTKSGLAEARRQGRVGGRPRAMTDAQVDHARRQVAAGVSFAEVARLLRVSERTVRRYCHG